MPVTVVVGGQYGSEGKGKVAYELARQQQADIVVRVGGSNSGHTAVDDNGRTWVFRHIPTGALHPNTMCVLPAGSYIDIDVLEKEISDLSLDDTRLAIDPNAVVITGQERLAEQDSSLREKIGSTLSGTGSAVVQRVARTGMAHRACNSESLACYLRPTSQLMRDALSRGARVIIEGTQGFGLSVLHSPYYPQVTSRDTTAAGFVSEAGLSPLDVDSVIMVIRAFPIRVAGNSGPLPNEIDWETISGECGSVAPIIERTSVTGVVRRVARFHPRIVEHAIAANAPTDIVLNHIDYVDRACAVDGVLTDTARDFVLCVESSIGRSITYGGFGPSSFESMRILSKMVTDQ